MALFKKRATVPQSVAPAVALVPAPAVVPVED
jgi:hypothetical protein